MRRAFTLIEAIAAIVVISLAAPTTFVLMRDVAGARRNAVVSERAIWLAAGVMEHVLADVESDASGFGPEILTDISAYLAEPTSGLRARLNGLSSVYEAQGLSWSLTTSEPVAADGVSSGDSGKDAFRVITVTVGWSRQAPGDATFTLSRMVTIQ